MPRDARHRGQRVLPRLTDHERDTSASRLVQLWGRYRTAFVFRRGAEYDEPLTVQEFAPHDGAGSVGASDLGKPGSLKHGESSSEDGRW